MKGVAGATFQKDILFAFGGGDPRITIAVLDGPVDRTHDCFRGARLSPLDTAAQARGHGGSATAHGTHVASLIFGQACSSAEGLAPLCRGLIAPIFADHGPRCTQLELARAVELAVDHGAQVIHLSAGWFRGQEAEPRLRQAFEKCAASNVLIVAADGGHGCGSFAADLAADAGAPVLEIGAIEYGRLPRSNDRGRAPHAIQVPTSSVIGAAQEGGVAYRSGANFSAALLSGVAGVLLGIQLRAGLPPNPSAVRDAILGCASVRTTAGAAPRREFTGRNHLQRAVERMTQSLHDAPPVLPFDPSRLISG